jgi:subtilisin family serine protease
MRAKRAVRRPSHLVALASLTLLSTVPRLAHADGVDGAALLRMLGPRAQQAFAPTGAPGVGALVRLPSGTRASDVGLLPAAPGLARLYGTPAKLLAFADAHPGLPMEVVPPLHALLDTAGVFVEATTATARGLDGTGALVGVADTGLDVTHADFLDAQGHSRVKWLLDLSAPPRGQYPALEKKYGTLDGNGNVTYGAVWQGSDLDAAMAAHSSNLPQDEVGHGTLVTSCAAGNGEQGTSPFRGIAPDAQLVIARVAAAGSESIANDDLLRGVSFLFDQADAMKMPVVVNLSIGSNFGPHDGSMDWEQALASHVGAAYPGHALVVAAGNYGSIVDTPVHQSVRVSPTETMSVPIPLAAPANGGVQVWVAMHEGAALQVGLDGPDGTWISPVQAGQSGGKTTANYTAGVYNGSGSSGSPVPSGSLGAVAIWQGVIPAGTYNITLSGTGSADLYLQGTGDLAPDGSVGFTYGVRESTVTLPATNGSLIGVGCTINKTEWVSVQGVQLGLAVPDLDTAGGLPGADGGSRDPLGGEPCWFSSAGPTLTGLQKPEIMAPGAAIVGALSAQALPGGAASIFTNPSCPTKAGQPSDPYCQQIDATHGVSFGTSFSSPIVAGAAAVLLQNDPTLTQGDVLAALQGGVHKLRGAAPFADQSGVGEVDVLGAVEAADRMRNPSTALPVLSASWLTPGGDFFLADGSTPMQVILELRAASTGSGPPPVADGFSEGRLVAYALVGGQPQQGAVQSLVRRGPGVWVATAVLPPGLGGQTLTLGATFDGAEIVGPVQMPIAVDAWSAGYPASVTGGCGPGPAPRDAGLVSAMVILMVALARGRRSVNAERILASGGTGREAVQRRVGVGRPRSDG